MVASEPACSSAVEAEQASVEHSQHPFCVRGRHREDLQQTWTATDDPCLVSMPISACRQHQCCHWGAPCPVMLA